VSTTEVTQQLSQAMPDIELLNVYGVPVPGHNGQAGMAAIVMKQGREFDGARLYAAATRELPHKLRKVDLRSQGFDPRKVTDPLLVLSHRRQAYVPLDDAALQELGITLPPGN